MKITMEEAASYLKQGERFLITAHTNPDGDAIGSCLGLQAYLRAQGKTAEVFIDDDLPRNLSFLPGYAGIRRPDGKDGKPDFLVVLDTDNDRIGEVATCAPGAKILNIDHHISNNGQADYLYLAKRAAATEMIFEIVEYLGGEFSREVAIPLYVGLATDTGFFRFSNTTAHAMRMGARLLEAGVIPNEVSEILEMKPLDVVMGQAKALETLELFAEGRVAGIFLEKAFADKMESTEGFIDLIRVIEGVEIAVLIKEIEERHCRVSIRSKGINVSEIAVRFGGGGHIRAAGCTLNMTLAEAKAALLPALAEAVEKQP